MDINFHKEVFPTAKFARVYEITDSISKEPVNTKIVELLDQKKQSLGYFRHLVTTTGCNSACLPIEATLYYSVEKKFKKLRSKKGLTKKNHTPMTNEDYKKLEFILTYNPKELSKVNHPKDMVDVITGETKKYYKESVVKEAAYSSLRINLYNQDTLKKLGKLSASPFTLKPF